MAKFESSVKQVAASQETVYRTISDLNNLERLRDRIPEDKITDFSFDSDSLTVSAPMVGQISLQIVERTEPKCVKFGSTQSPVPFNVWIQVLPVDEQNAKIKVTIDADIPFMLKAMVSGPLQQGVDKIAEVLTMVPYEEFER